MAVHRLAWLTCDTEGCKASTRRVEKVADIRQLQRGWWSTSLYGIKGDFCGQCVSNARAASGSVRT
jgi:hypothetical protein